MQINNVWKYVQLSIIIGIISGFGLILNDINKNNIIENERIVALHKQEMAKIMIENVRLKNEIKQKENKIMTLAYERNELKELIKANRGESERWEKFKVSFYGLDYTSCGKRKNHPAYGLTKSGFNLRGMDWKEARTIAVDSNVIPLNSRVMIKFLDNKYSQFSGVFIARDTGRLIKKNRIDFYVGEDCYDLCMELGITEALVQILK